MSHAIYSFLVSLDLEQDEDDIKTEAMTAYAGYAESHADDNNWDRPIAVITKDGRQLLFDRRLYDAEAGEEAGATPAQTWRSARRFALDCVVFDLWRGVGDEWGLSKEVREKLNAMGDTELAAAVREQVPKALIGAYEDLLWVQNNSVPLSEKYSPMMDYRRRRLTRLFEMFIDTNVVPFSRQLAAPEVYRCYDISTTDDDGNAIMQIDIHT